MLRRVHTPAYAEGMNALASRPWLAAYAEGVPADIEPVAQTLIDMLDDAVARYPKRPALEFFGAVTTYRELAEQVARVAGALYRRGVRAVAIVWDAVADTIAEFPSDIRPRHIVAVPLPEAMPRRLRLLLRLPVRSAREKRAALGATPKAKGILRWSAFGDGRRVARSAARPTLDDIAALQFTSGTTGRPKAAVLTHRNLRSNAAQSAAWVPGLRHGDEVFYAVLPLFHAYGLTLCMTTAISVGARIVLFPTFEVDMVMDAIRRTPPTFLPAVPPIYDALARATARAGLDLSSLRNAISGAMALPASTVLRWEQATGGILVEGYGMTESSPISLGNPMGPRRRVGTVGVPFPSTEIRVVDPDDPTSDRAIGEPGELLVRGPQVFEGYWKAARGDCANAHLGWMAAHRRHRDR
jgi:long-chain acyl-CoA synthetase